MAPGDAGALRLVFPTPQPGRWQVTIANLHGGEGYHFTLLATTPPPTLTVATPRMGVTVAHPRVVLAGRLVGEPSWGSSVSLFYAAGAGSRAGTAIATTVPLVHGTWRYTWNTSAVPAGLYQVYAVLNDGLGPDVVGDAHGTVRVIQPAHPGAPRWVLMAHQGRMYRVAWGTPASPLLISGYHLYYRDAAMPAGHWNDLDLGGLRTVMLAQQRPGLPYEFAVAAYDSAGHLSPRAVARLAPLTASAHRSRCRPRARAFTAVRPWRSRSQSGPAARPGA